MSTVYDDLISVVGLEPEEGEDAQTYLHRVVKAVNELEEGDWNKISGEGQEWFNTSAKAISEADEGVLPELPEIPGMPAMKAKGKKRGRKPGSTNSGEPKAERKPKREGDPVTTTVRKMICANIDMSFGDLIAACEAQGIAIAKSSAQVVYLNAHKTFEAIQASGGVKNKDGQIVISYQG